MLNVVSREEVVSADRADVWGALTDANRVALWFGDRADMDLRVGGAVTFGWPAGEVSKGVVTVLEPMERFAFRWDVFGTVVDPAGFTTVEFQLRDVAGGVAVRVIETGLDDLARRGVAPSLDDLYEEHIDGWRNEMSDLVHYLSTTVTGPPRPGRSARRRVH
jgi:uncharacterized protein YndB with AHSA1/START domain